MEFNKSYQALMHEIFTATKAGVISYVMHKTQTDPRMITITFEIETTPMQKAQVSSHLYRKYKHICKMRFNYDGNKIYLLIEKV